MMIRNRKEKGNNNNIIIKEIKANIVNINNIYNNMLYITYTVKLVNSLYICI